MEDSPPLKIRSDLYPHARAPQNMTSTSDSAPTIPHKMPPSATLSQQCKTSDHEKERKEDISEKTQSSQHYYSPTENPIWGPTTGMSGDECEKRKCSVSPSNDCRRTSTDSAVEPPLAEAHEENEKWEEAPQRADSPIERTPPAYSQGTPYRLPHGIQETNENIMVSREYASPLATSVDKTVIPPLSFHPFIRAENETCYSGRSPPSSDQEETIEVGEDETLDLSLSSRSKESKLPQLPTSPTPPPAPFNPFVAFPGLAARFHEMNPMFHDGYEQGVPKSPFTSSLYGSNLPPHLIPWIISSQIQNLVQQQQAARAEGTRANILESCNGAISLEDRDQQPLDLSAKKQEEPKILAPEDDLVARVLEMKPSTRGRRRADSSKRSYTDFELHAALREIQSGKLGTRKAAVKYGIPRSTLRNKVYKLQLVRDSAKNAADQKNNLATILPDSTASCRTSLFASKPTESDANEDTQGEALKSIIRKKMTEKLDELSRSSQTYLSGGDQQRLVESALMYLFENIPKLALNSDNKDVPSDVLSSLSLYPQLHDFTQKIVEERFYEELKRINNNSSNEPKLPEVANGYNFDSSTASINIPTYPSIYKCNPSSIPMRTEELKSGSNSSHPTCTSPPQGNLKDMIAQIINQKILGEEVPVELQNSATASPPFLPLSVQRMESPFLKADVKMSEEIKSQQDPNKKRAKSPSSGGGKGSRPKRGKYRNYDRDNLLKAVQAVQSGEMSVHRAGSFYGVPHSTLEYKVKERHLNRGKSKKDNIGASNIPLLKAEKENSTFNSTIPTSAFVKEYKTDTPDTTTKELLTTENRCNNDEISIISVHSPPAKKVRKSDPNESFTNLPITSNPFLTSPFPFWNNTSPILAPFLSHPYQTDPLYASQVMTNFQKAASKLNNLDSRQSSPSPNNSETKTAEASSNESSLNRIQGLFSNGGGGGVGGGGGGGSISSSPPSSPPIQDGLLNSLLRKKFENQLNESRVPWSINPNSCGNNQREEIKDHKNDIETNVVPQAGLLTLKALLPSFIAARTSLAAAAAIAADNTIPTASKQPSSPPQPASPLPMINESTHRPVVSGICGTPLSESP